MLMPSEPSSPNGRIHPTLTTFWTHSDLLDQISNTMTMLSPAVQQHVLQEDHTPGRHANDTGRHVEVMFRSGMCPPYTFLPKEKVRGMLYLKLHLLNSSTLMLYLMPNMLNSSNLVLYSMTYSILDSSILFTDVMNMCTGFCTQEDHK